MGYLARKMFWQEVSQSCAGPKGSHARSHGPSRRARDGKSPCRPTLWAMHYRTPKREIDKYLSTVDTMSLRVRRDPVNPARYLLFAENVVHFARRTIAKCVPSTHGSKTTITCGGKPLPASWVTTPAVASPLRRSRCRPHRRSGAGRPRHRPHGSDNNPGRMQYRPRRRPRRAFDAWRRWNRRRCWPDYAVPGRVE